MGLGVVTFGVVGFFVGFGFPCASTLMTKNEAVVISGFWFADCLGLMVQLGLMVIIQCSSA